MRCLLYTLYTGFGPGQLSHRNKIRCWFVKSAFIFLQPGRDANLVKHGVPCRRNTNLEARQATLLVAKSYGPGGQHVSRPAGRCNRPSLSSVITVSSLHPWQASTAWLGQHQNCLSAWLAVRAKLIRRLHGRPSNQKSLTFSKEE
jgi:hypothetical protein